jgi:hypothetical protein
MDLFSYGESKPPSDSQNDYTDVKVTPIGGGRFNVTASRLLDTGDKYDDTIIKLVRDNITNYLSLGHRVLIEVYICRFLSARAAPYRLRSLQTNDLC